jgi:hypothetical protein
VHLGSDFISLSALYPLFTHLFPLVIFFRETENWIWLLFYLYKKLPPLARGKEGEDGKEMGSILVFLTQ